MPGGFQPDVSLCNGRAYGSSNASFGSGGTAILPSATANTKGSWVQITAATVGDTTEIWVFTGGQTNTAYYEQAIDIGIGAGGSERVFIPNIVVAGQGQYSPNFVVVRVPLSIPSGTRIAARAACSAASAGADMQVSVRCFDGAYGAPDYAGIEDIGFSAATTRGTAITPGNGSKGSYAQFIASTARDYCGFYLTVDGGATGAGDPQNVDIAIGAAASEQIIIPDVFFQLNHAASVVGPFMVDVPAGTRLSGRAADISGAATAVGITLHGLYK